MQCQWPEVASHREHTHKTQPSLCDRPHFIWSFPPKRLPAEPHDMCKSPPRKLGLAVCKKGPPVGQSCAIIKKKKRRERDQAPRKPGWDRSHLGPGPVPRLLLPPPPGPFSPPTVLSFPSPYHSGLVPPEGLGAVLSGKEAGPAVQFEGVTHADTPKHVLPHWPQPHQKTQGFPGPPTPSPSSCHL